MDEGVITCGHPNFLDVLFQLISRPFSIFADVIMIKSYVVFVKN